MESLPDTIKARFDEFAAPQKAAFRSFCIEVPSLSIQPCLQELLDEAHLIERIKSRLEDGAQQVVAQSIKGRRVWKIVVHYDRSDLDQGAIVDQWCTKLLPQLQGAIRQLSRQERPGRLSFSTPSLARREEAVGELKIRFSVSDEDQYWSLKKAVCRRLDCELLGEWEAHSTIIWRLNWADTSIEVGHYPFGIYPEELNSLSDGKSRGLTSLPERTSCADCLRIARAQK